MSFNQRSNFDLGLGAGALMSGDDGKTGCGVNEIINARKVFNDSLVDAFSWLIIPLCVPPIPPRRVKIPSPSGFIGLS